MWSRRSWMKALGGAAGATVMSGGLKAALQCGSMLPPYGEQGCVAGIPEARLNFVFAYQQASEWCWAACMQMVFSYWGHPVPQREIVRQTWGAITDMPAQPQQIVADLNRDWTDIRGDQFTVEADCFTATGAEAAQDLAREMPLIVGSLGHAMVLSAVSYQRVPNGQGQVTGAVVRDPLRGKRALSPMEAAAVMLLARIRVL